MIKKLLIITMILFSYKPMQAMEDQKITSFSMLKKISVDEKEKQYQYLLKQSLDQTKKLLEKTMKKLHIKPVEKPMKKTQELSKIHCIDSEKDSRYITASNTINEILISMHNIIMLVGQKPIDKTLKADICHTAGNTFKIIKFKDPRFSQAINLLLKAYSLESLKTNS
jgi:hypothetical protein